MREHEHIYHRTYARLLRRFPRTPRVATFHASAFVAYSTIVGFASTALSGSGMMHGLVYLSILFWSALICLHIGVTWWGSSANARRRERFVQEAVTDAGDDYDLTPEDMVVFHSRLSHEAIIQGRSFSRLMLAGIGFAVTWGSGFGLMAFMTTFGFFLGGSNTAYEMIMLMSLFVTLAVGAGFLPIRSIFGQPEESVDQLRAIYYNKSKRRPLAMGDHVDAYDDASLGDDGEILAWEADALSKRKHS